MIQRLRVSLHISKLAQLTCLLVSLVVIIPSSFSSAFVARSPSSNFLYSSRVWGSTGALGSSTTDWKQLTEDGGVQKIVLEAGPEGEALLKEGSFIVISYEGKLADANWAPAAVIKCWLAEQQGIDFESLQQVFQIQEIDESKLIDTENFFTEAFVQETLGITAKIACKKLIMAARRLGTTRQETVSGTIFDSKDEYEVIVGPKGKVISGMKLGISTMTVGETARMRIRSDYAYGAEGYRKSTGEVVVPPFATLEFHVQVKSIQSSGTSIL